jgi:WD40 repeat protein
VWDTATGREVVAFRHAATVYSAAFSPDASRVVTAGSDKAARVWDAVSGKELFALRHAAPVHYAAFSPDGRRVVTAGTDKAARVWDATSGEELLALTGHTDGVWFAAYSPDGSRIVTGSNDQTAKVWTAAGEELLTLTGHTRGVTSAAFVLGGNRLVTGTGGWDGLKMWNARTGKELGPLMKLSGRASAGLFSPDGARFVTPTSNRFVRVRDARTGTRARCGPPPSARTGAGS